jgi:CDP-diacylglycerol--glycerol-3-phosphate 3-phosphatidyltransferase
LFSDEFYEINVMSVAKHEKRTESIRRLLFESGKAVRIINLITLYRIVTFPLLVFFIVTHQVNIFKWLLLVSFFTDAIDGFLARKYNARSVLGSRLDSIGDDLTILAAVVGLFVTQFDFIQKELTPILILFGLFFIQLIFSLIRYKKISSFHTYLAKTAAVVTGLFLLSVFFFDKIIYPFFYASYIITSLELIEEIVIVIILLPKWKTNVKGLYWILKGRLTIRNK